MCLSRSRFHDFLSRSRVNPTFETKYDFLELFCILIMSSISRKRNFEDNFSAKIEVGG